MSNGGRRLLNCAAANTAPFFEDRPGYVMTPTNNEIHFLNDPDVSKKVSYKNEHGEEAGFFEKIKPGSVLIVGENDLEKPEEGISIALNLADSVILTETMEVNGKRYAAVMFSSRETLGDRDGEAQLGRRAIEIIMDREGITDPALRAATVDRMSVQVDVGFSATLPNFAHKVTVPEIELPEGMTARQAVELIAAETAAKVPAKERDQRLSGPTRYGLSIAAKNGLIDPSSGELSERITPTMVMADQYPGALENGEIYGQFEGENNLEEAPRGPGGCPGDGELCHIHYPKITRRTREGELVAMGVRPENIVYNAQDAIDTSSPDNMFASNRLMQLQGVTVGKTLRSVNGVTIKFPRRRPSPRPHPQTRVTAATPVSA